MNFLAHQYLSFGIEKIRVGNYLGDFVKGRNLEDHDETIAAGIQLHRFIDWYTDNHSVVEKSKEVFRPVLGKYSGVASDLSFDHLLAKNWSDYSNVSLLDFSKETYEILNRYESILGERGKMTLFYMSKNNWLLNYSKFQGIERSFIGLSGRTKYRSNLEKGPAVVKENYELIESHFKQFFPELMEASKEKLEELTQ